IHPNQPRPSAIKAPVVGSGTGETAFKNRWLGSVKLPCAVTFTWEEVTSVVSGGVPVVEGKIQLPAVPENRPYSVTLEKSTVLGALLPVVLNIHIQICWPLNVESFLAVEPEKR